MKKVFIFNKKKSWFHREPDLDELNLQLKELQDQGIEVDSITPTVNLLGNIISYVIILSYHPDKITL
ncbi:hypothetical protein EAG18_03530 [Pseudoalteromonas sp. J010]|nr:hypothetical protein EAG18_03530 [Pseudoalteromonas sp. J010]